MQISNNHLLANIRIGIWTIGMLPSGTSPSSGLEVKIWDSLGYVFPFYYRDRLKFRYITVYPISFAKKCGYYSLYVPTTQKLEMNSSN